MIVLNALHILFYFLRVLELDTIIFLISQIQKLKLRKVK